jgi:23S rRNA pseudouridine2605 synthase
VNYDPIRRNKEQPMQERLQKIISDYGLTSRRKAEKLIEEGRVTVNGETAYLGMKATHARI